MREDLLLLCAQVVWFGDWSAGGLVLRTRTTRVAFGAVGAVGAVRNCDLPSPSPLRLFSPPLRRPFKRKSKRAWHGHEVGNVNHHDDERSGPTAGINSMQCITALQPRTPPPHSLYPPFPCRVATRQVRLLRVCGPVCIVCICLGVSSSVYTQSINCVHSQGMEQTSATPQ